MNNEIYGRRQFPAEKTGKTDAIVTLIVLVVIIAFGAYYSLVYRPHKVAVAAAAQAAYAAVVAKAPAEIEAAFNAWSATTVESGTVVKWSGAESQFLYIQFQPASSSYTGIDAEEHWKVWAKSKSGRVFSVTFWLDDALRFVPNGPVEESTEILLRNLISDKREDLVKKLNFPVKPA